VQKREKATDHVTGNGAVQVCGTREEGDAVYTLTLERASLVELHRGVSICQYTTAMFLCYDSPDPQPTVQFLIFLLVLSNKQHCLSS